MAVKSVQVIINGVTTNLALNSSTGLYEGNVTAPSKSSYNVNSDHYYPVAVKATDDAGNIVTVNDNNSTLGNKLKLKVKEKTAPIIVITNPTEGEFTNNPTPTVNWTVTDADSGVNADSIGITIDDGSKIKSGISKTAITNGYQCSYTISTTLADGSHTIKINANDNDGNAATQRTVNFTVDTVPPQLSVASPINDLITNDSELVVSGTAKDTTSNPTSVTVRINGGTAQSVEVNSDGSFSLTVALGEGANTIVVTAIDAGGMTSSVTRIVTLDTDAPTITDVSINPNPVSTGEILSVTVEVTD